MDLTRTGVLDAARLLRDGEITSVDLMGAYLDRIEEVNGGPPTADGAPDAINAWARVYPDLAHEQARRADERRRRDPATVDALCGLPVALKDVFAVRGLPITASSDVLADHIAQEDCEVWRCLASRSTVLLGHTHTHEFAAGSTTDQCGNPWQLDRSAGGSSGGSAAAVAARMAPVALGTDTAGSLRIPAALCGISTIKPTRGLIPIDGVLPLAETLDHIGPLARTVADCAAVYSALAQRAVPTSPRPGPKPLAGQTIAVTDRLDGVDIDADIGDLVEDALRAVQDLGARVVTRPAPSGPLDGHDAQRVAADFTTILKVDNWSYHRQWAERAAAYQDDVAGLVAQGRDNPPTPDEYASAQADRNRLGAAWQRWMQDNRIDAVLEPSVPITAPLRGGRGSYGPHSLRLAQLTPHWNMTGQPVVGLPAGFGNRTQLPVGVSLVGRRDGDAALVQIALDLQEHALPALSWPNLTGAGGSG